ncbi:hypothetical protein AB6A40_008234 [Gnathostoma spinigerum]|uniref:Uncharacterized protein n=1 Tax=Gnathostoma spinigerum TaxID=75299 RepID=A0ABD6EZ26_9BILA
MVFFVTAYQYVPGGNSQVPRHAAAAFGICIDQETGKRFPGVFLASKDRRIQEKVRLNKLSSTDLLRLMDAGPKAI